MSLAAGIIEGRAQNKAMRWSTDIAIIGSGAGGATAARVLAEAGHEVLILEEGPYVSAVRHGEMRPTESLRHVWRGGGMTVAVGRGESPMVNVTMGRAVGGSSLVTGGVCFRTPDRVLDGWVKDKGLTTMGPEALAPHFDEVEAWMQVGEVPERLQSKAVRLFGEGLQARYPGAEFLPLKRNTPGCEGAGRCNFGCPHGAKISVDLAALPHAVRRGARIVSDALVTQLIIDDGGRRVKGVKGRLKSGQPFYVEARRVVLAGGAWHNPVLLGRSGFRHRDLGRHMTLHPSFRTMARFRERVESWHGALQSAYSPSFMDEGLTLNALTVPPGVMAAGLPGFGADHAARAEQLEYIGVFGCLLHDEGGGQVHVLPGREPVVSYEMGGADRLSLARAIIRMAEIYFAAGAEEVFLPVLGHRPLTRDDLLRDGSLKASLKMILEKLPPSRIECTSQHPLGTCRMGSDPRQSIVDPNGRSWEIDNLWIADGSVIPSSLGVNPQETVMAVAHHVASSMLQTPLAFWT